MFGVFLILPQRMEEVQSNSFSNKIFIRFLVFFRSISNSIFYFILSYWCPDVFSRIGAWPIYKPWSSNLFYNGTRLARWFYFIFKRSKFKRLLFERDWLCNDYEQYFWHIVLQRSDCLGSILFCSVIPQEITLGRLWSLVEYWSLFCSWRIDSQQFNSELFWRSVKQRDLFNNRQSDGCWRILLVSFSVRWWRRWQVIENNHWSTKIFQKQRDPVGSIE